jgi:aminoglycoside phosphotransferase (APT) family kinase protein
MARSHLTLAALATAAVPGFEPTGTQTLSTGAHGEFDTALVSQRGGETYLVRVPTSMSSQNDLINQVVALNAMTQGVRSRLIFEVPAVIGRAPIAKTFGAVFDYLPGNVISLRDFEGNLSLAILVGRATGSIHQLPTGFVGEAGLPVFSALETQRQTAELVERGRLSGLLPASLMQRWSEAVTDDSLWQFEPTVIHGALSVDRFVIGEDSVSAVLGWGSLRVGDPAWDLHWLVSLDAASQNQAFESYTDVRQSAVDPKIHERAVLYSELELVRWLVHGLELSRQDIVDDAVAMLDRLTDTVRYEGENTVGQAQEPVLDLLEVETLLESTPDVEPSNENETAEIFAPTKVVKPVETAEHAEHAEHAHFITPESNVPGFVSPEAVADESFGDEAVSPDDVETAPAPLLAPRVDESGNPLPSRDVPRFSDEG